VVAANLLDAFGESIGFACGFSFGNGDGDAVN
jgi:hypothetical protein